MFDGDAEVVWADEGESFVPPPASLLEWGEPVDDELPPNALRAEQPILPASISTTAAVSQIFYQRGVSEFGEPFGDPDDYRVPGTNLTGLFEPEDERD